MERGKKYRTPEDLGHLLVQNQNFDICARPSQNVVKGDSSGQAVVLLMHFRPD